MYLYALIVDYWFKTFSYSNKMDGLEACIVYLLITEH